MRQFFQIQSLARNAPCLILGFQWKQLSSIHTARTAFPFFFEPSFERAELTSQGKLIKWDIDLRRKDLMRSSKQVAEN